MPLIAPTRRVTTNMAVIAALAALTFLVTSALAVSAVPRIAVVLVWILSTVLFTLVAIPSTLVVIVVIWVFKSLTRGRTVDMTFHTAIIKTMLSIREKPKDNPEIHNHDAGINPPPKEKLRGR